MSFSHGQVLNLANVARESQVERKSVEGYVSILEHLLIAFRLPVFARRAKRELIAHEKFYFFDAEVFRALLPQGPLDGVEVLASVAFEGLIAQQLRAWLSYRQGDASFYFWRTRGGTEVDFVLYGDLGLIAIDAKYSSRVRSEDRGAREHGEPGALRTRALPSLQTGTLFTNNPTRAHTTITCMTLRR